MSVPAPATVPSPSAAPTPLSESTPASAASIGSTASPSLVVPRSSVEFFASAAPKLHAYVRDIHRENEALRAQNDQLRSDASILDSISDFLREMSKTDMNYKQFMKFKTKEVEDAKKAKAAAEDVNTDPDTVASKWKTELPPVKATPAKAALAAASSSSAAPTATSSTISASSAATSSSNGSSMFGGMKGGFFTRPAAADKANPAVAPALSDVIVPPPSATTVAPVTSPSSPVGVDFTIQPCLPHHVPQIASIYAHWVATGTGTFEEEPPSVDEMTRRREDLISKHYPYIVATRPSSGESSGEQVIGYAYAGPFRLRSAYRFTVEDSIYIHPDYINSKRSQESVSPSTSNRSGLGHALLTELIRLCRAAGYQHMLSLIGDSKNNASIRLHEKLGFSHSGNMKDVGFKFQRWLDVVIMQLELNPTSESKNNGDGSYPLSTSPTPSNPQQPQYRQLQYQGGQLTTHQELPNII